MTTLRQRSTVEAVADGVILTPDTAWGAWQLPVHSYRLLSPGGKIAARDRLTSALAELRDRDLHLRIVPAAYDPDEWADRITAATVRPAPGFSWYRDAQRDYLWQRRAWHKQVHAYVRLGDRRRPTGDGTFARLGLRSPQPPVDEVAEWQARAAALGAILEHGTSSARPLTGWELMRAIAADAHRDGHDLPRPVRRRRYGRGSVLAMPAAEYVEHPRHLEQVHPRRLLIRWLAVDTVPDELAFPGSEWLMFKGVGFPVEVSIRTQVVPHDKLVAKAQKARRSTGEQADDSVATGNDVPAEVVAAHQGLRRIEAITADERVPVLDDCYIRLAVWADTVDELDARTTMLVNHLHGYSMEAYTAADDQAALHLEAQPGGKVHRLAGLPAPHRHAMAVRSLAGGMPHAATQLGDGQGWYVGDTIDDKPVHLDPLRAAQATEGDAESGPTGMEFTGISGSGKSTAMGMLLIGAAYRGWSAFAVDPSNQLGRIGTLPGIGPVEVRALTPDDAGALDPLAQYRGDDPMHAADDAAAVCSLLLRPDLAGVAETVVHRACQRAAGDDRPTMHGMLSALRADTDRDAQRAYEALEVAAHSRIGRLFFAGRTPPNMDPSEHVTILQVQGLRVPKAGTPRADYSAGDRAASAALLMIANLAARVVTVLPRHLPKLVVVDELHTIADTQPGRQMISQLLRDGRKHNGAAAVGSQACGDFGGDEIEANVGHRFGFRAELDAEIARVLEAHNLEPTQANMQLIRTLPNGACLYSSSTLTDVLRWNRLLTQVREVLDTRAPIAPARTPVKEGAAA